jgi:hypothetical protein
VSEKKAVRRDIAIVLGTICIILAVGLVGMIVNYASIISGDRFTIASLDSQVSTLQNQVTTLQNQVNILNGIFYPSRSKTVRISWFEAWPTPDRTKLGITVTIFNNGSVPAENVSLIIDINYTSSPQLPVGLLNVTEGATNLTTEVKRLEIGDSYTLRWFAGTPGGKLQWYSVDCTVYVNGVKTDHQGLGVLGSMYYTAYYNEFNKTPVLRYNYSFSPPVSMYQALLTALKSGGWNATSLKNMIISVELDYFAFWKNVSMAGGELVYPVTCPPVDWSPKQINDTTYRYVWTIIGDYSGPAIGIPPPIYYYVDAATAELLSPGIM